MHADYEIYKIRCYDGKIRYAFDVEYYGHYVCNTIEQARKKVDVVRVRVQHTLEEIEKQNQQYYDKLAKKEQKILQQLKTAKRASSLL